MAPRRGAGRMASDRFRTYLSPMVTIAFDAGVVAFAAAGLYWALA